MAAYNKFLPFVEYLPQKVFALSGSPPADTFMIGLSNTAPANTDATWSQITEITAGNGYTAGGSALVSPTGTYASGVFTLASNQVVFTASGGAIGPFQYIVLYDSTPASPAKPLIAWWDHGSALTLNSGDSFTVQFNSASTAGTIFTLS